MNFGLSMTLPKTHATFPPMKTVALALLIICSPLVSGDLKPLNKPAGLPGPIVEKLQKTWDSAKTYQADFKQILFYKRMGTREETTGTLFVSKPGKLRWESKTDGQIQIMNGKQLWVIKPNKRRGIQVVDIYRDLKKVVDPKPMAFLSGTGKFKELYEMELLQENGKMAEVKFFPKAQSSDSLIAEIDKESYGLRSLTTDSPDSRARTEFNNTKVNPTLDDKLFEYKVLPTDVVHEN